MSNKTAKNASASLGKSAVAGLFAAALSEHRAGRLEQAWSQYHAVLQREPNHFDARHLLGVIAQQRGQPARAVELISAAIKISPNSAAAHNNLGVAHLALQQTQQALQSFDQALALQADHLDALFNRGNALVVLRRLNEAVACFSAVASLDTWHVGACNNLGNTLLELGQAQEAIEAFDRCLALQPNLADVHYNRGDALNALRRYEEAVASFEAARRLNPDGAFTQGVLGDRMRLCLWDDFEPRLADIKHRVAAGLPTISPLALLALDDDAALHKIAARTWVEAKHAAGSTREAPLACSDTHRLRIGYYSADFRNHPVSQQLIAVLEHHDKAAFEVFAFSFGPQVNDAMQQRVRAAVDHFIDISSRSDEQVAQLSRDLGLDIAIDLAGLTAAARPGMFAARCAPVQACYLGYAGTMGVNYIDYLIADAVTIPVSHRQHYSEQIIALPGCFMPHDTTQALVVPPLTRAEAGLPEQGFVFRCYNSSYKILPDTFACWMRLLQQVPGSVLWLNADNPATTANLRAQALVHGIAPDRLVFADRASLPVHHARNRLADLFLDTFPYGAHSTAADALWSGLPVLTRRGESFASRVCASLLLQAGLPELVTESAADYERQALQLATSATLLPALRDRLQSRCSEQSLFNMPQLTRDLQRALVWMHKNALAQSPPAHLELTS